MQVTDQFPLFQVYIMKNPSQRFLPNILTWDPPLRTSDHIHRPSTMDFTYLFLIIKSITLHFTNTVIVKTQWNVNVMCRQNMMVDTGIRLDESYHDKFVAPVSEGLFRCKSSLPTTTEKTTKITTTTTIFTTTTTNHTPKFIAGLKLLLCSLIFLFIIL